jgi:hypothetical protein
MIFQVVPQLINDELAQAYTVSIKNYPFKKAFNH